MQTLSRVNRQPLYQQVRQILLKTIQSGEWKPGEKIPIEPVLAQQVGVSIGTLRRAVETLVNDGILLRREGAGTFVRTYRDQGYWNAFQIFRNLDGQERGSRGRLVTFEVTSDVDEKNSFSPAFVKRTRSYSYCSALDQHENGGRGDRFH